MTQLNETDKAAFRELSERGWVEGQSERSPRVVLPTTEARERYTRWASEVSTFFKGTKRVDFSGEHWKL